MYDTYSGVWVECWDLISLKLTLGFDDFSFSSFAIGDCGFCFLNFFSSFGCFTEVSLDNVGSSSKSCDDFILVRVPSSGIFSSSSASSPKLRRPVFLKNYHIR